MQTLIYLLLYIAFMIGVAFFTGSLIRKKNRGQAKSKIISMNSVVISKARQK